ncbi:diguanylate cyclase [Kineococcus sp. LSe6-4]|uniref:Diguanylate cyclase n=1 Tax=Kineococcus halophytocola TaxID=3234027 RepID=A0ABV4GZ03_9ACTN
MTRPAAAAGTSSRAAVPLGLLGGLLVAVLVLVQPRAGAAVVLTLPALGLLLALRRGRPERDREWRWIAVGVSLLLVGAPGTWDLLLAPPGPVPAAPALPLLLTGLGGLGAYAVLFAANLRLLLYQRSAVLPHVNAWFDGVASLAALAAVLTATAVPALAARGIGTTAALAWPARPLLLLVLTAFAAANCGLVSGGQRQRPVRVLVLFLVLLTAEVADLVHLVGIGDGGPVASLTPAVAAGLRVLAASLLLRAVRARSPHPRVVADLGWPTVAAPVSVFCLTGVAAVWRTGHPGTSVLALAFEVVALATVAAKLVLLTRLLVSLLGSHRLSLLDELTGLANRRAFFAEVEHVPAGVPLAVLLIDLDGFKAVNDTHGHHTGDLLLRDTAARLQDAVGPDGLVARLGGDEFVVLLTGPQAARAEEVAAALVGRLGPREVDGHHLRVSASVGVAGPRACADGAAATGRDRGTALLRAADAAMYRAKAGGGAGHRAA